MNNRTPHEEIRLQDLYSADDILSTIYEEGILATHYEKKAPAIRAQSS